MSHILEVDRVTKVFARRGGGRVLAVDNVTFSVEEGRSTMVAVAGDSGSGKTTFALLMMGQHEPTSGTVRYRGQDLARMSTEEKSQLRREIQPIYQDPYGAYNPYYRVDHVLEMPIARYNLAESKAAPEVTQGVFDGAQSRLEEAGYDTSQTPFGYFLNLDIQAPGHPLARLFKDIHPPAAEA